jgi:zinc protease
LPSGMRVLLEVDHTQPVVGVASVIDCGSVQDPPGKEGLAHLIEHLTFRARQDGKTQLSNQLDFAGAGARNALTEHELTLFYEIGPRESLPALLALEGSRLARPLSGIDEDVLDAEREVVRNELLQRDENGQVTAAVVALGAALYPAGHPYARPVIGSQASLWGLKLVDAQGFVEKCYQPRNYTVVISGDFDPASLGPILDAAFPPSFLAAPPGGPVVPKSRLDPVAPRLAESPPDEGVRWVKAPADTPMLYIGWTLPRAYDADGYLQTFLASGLESIATHSVADNDVVSIRASIERGKLGSTLVLIAVLRTGADPKATANHILRVVSRLENISASWFEKSKALSVVALARSTDDIQDRLVARAELAHLTGDPLTYRRELTAIQQLKRNDLESMAWEWMRAGRARVVFLKPDDWEAAGREAGGSPHVFAPSDDLPMHLAPSALKTYVHAPTATVRTLMLDSGLEVVLVRKFGATASVTLALKSGAATATPLGIADMASHFSYSFGALEASDWGIELGTSTLLDTLLIQAVGAGGNLENTLAVTAQEVMKRKVIERVPKAWAEEVLPILKEFEDKSGARTERALFESTFADSSYPRSPVVADYQKLGVPEVKDWVDRAYRPQNAVAVVVSDLEMRDSEALVRKAFEGWKGASAPPDAPFVAPEMKNGPVRTFRVDRPGAKQTKLLVACAARPRDSREAIALELLGARLRNRLRSFARGRSGGTYSLVNGTNISRRLSSVRVSGLIDDRNLTRVVALARKELNELASLRLADEELDRMKWQLGTTTTVAYLGSSELGIRLAAIRAADLPVEFVTDFPALLEQVNSDDITRVATACRATATLGLVGEPAVVDRAFRSTERGTNVSSEK